MSRNKTTILTREELYALVWLTPMRTLAKKYGLSDQGLAKKCKKHLIPRPPVGFWAKKEHGKPTKKTPLPKIDDPNLQEIHISPSPKQSHRRSTFRIKNSDKRITYSRQFTPPKKFSRYCHLVKQTKVALKNGHTDRYGFIKPPYLRKNECLDIRVTQSSYERAIRMMEILIRLFKEAGWTIAILKESTIVKIDDEELSIFIKERVKQTTHVLTEKEKNNRYSYAQKYDYIPTGILSLHINTYLGGSSKSKWTDKNKQRLEEQLPDIMKGFIIAAEIHRKNRLQREEETRRYKEAQRVVAEEKRQREIEKKRIDLLFNAATEWNSISHANTFLSSVKESIESGELEKSSALLDWIIWAEKVLQKCDLVSYIQKLLIKHDKQISRQSSMDHP